MKKILLSNGKHALISDCDLFLVSGYNWSVNRQGYIATCIAGKSQSIHRLIAKRMGLDCQNHIDHIDHNPLNNQRENLRAATNAQNQQNQKIPHNNTSGYKGVSWCAEKQNWRAAIRVEGKDIFLGRYDRKEAAAFAYKIAAKKYFGEFANVI